MSFISNPNAEEFVPTAEEEHRHSGERNAYSMGRGEAGHCVGKQTPRQRGRECRGWDGLGRLNPAKGDESTHRAGKQRAFIVIQGKIRRKRKKRWRGRTTRRLAKSVTVATYNVRTLAVKGGNGYGRAECVLAKARLLGCDFVGLQETRRPGESEFSAAGYEVFWSGQEETDDGQGLYGIGLVVKETICRKSVYCHRLIDERLIYVYALRADW